MFLNFLIFALRFTQLTSISSFVMHPATSNQLLSLDGHNMLVHKSGTRKILLPVILSCGKSHKQFEMQIHTFILYKIKRYFVATPLEV